MKKKSTILLSTALVLSFALGSFSGCGTGTENSSINPEDPNKLEIYVYNAGYGYEWAENILKEFVKEPWVQEKYPGIETKAKVEHDEVATRSVELLTASKKVNKYDIVMGTGLEGLIGPDVKVLDLTERVYNGEVPGESVLYKDKLLPSYLNSAAYRTKGETTDESIYYQTNWAKGITGLMYNETKLEALGYEVPNTTNELLSIMNSVKNRTPDSVYNQTTSFVTWGTSTYANYLYFTWWAQYQTAEEYINFYSGIDSTTESRSPAIFKQAGIYESLSVLEKILHRSNGITWVNPNTGREAYRETQNRVLLGNALFMANGDWVDNELKVLRDGLIELNGRADTVKLMRTPIISSIISRTPSIQDDATLSAVVAAIDAGETEYAGVSATDFNIIKEAREVVYSVGPGHNAYIPSEATGVNPAVDFLLYMATDKAQDIYIQTTNGASLPFKYNLQEKNPSLYNAISPMHQDIMTYFNQLNVNVLPSQASFPMVRYGGLNVMSSGSPLADFTGGASKGEYSSVAEMCFEREYGYWTRNNNASWKNCLAQAGMQ